jgi:hypothetical protein
LKKIYLAFPVGLLAVVAVGYGYYSLDEKPAVNSILNESAPSTTALAAPNQPVAAAPAASPARPVPPLAGPANGWSSRAEKLEQQMLEGNPAEQLGAYLEVAKCAQAQQRYAVNPTVTPSEAVLLNQEMNALCDGLTASVLSRRFAVIAKLARDKVPGAAAAYIAETEDGVPFEMAYRDPNHANWYKKATDYLSSAADAGDGRAISVAYEVYKLDPSRGLDFIRYRAAAYEQVRIEQQAAGNATLVNLARGNLEHFPELVKTMYKDYSDTQIRQAVDAGVALGKRAAKP